MRESLVTLKPTLILLKLAMILSLLLSSGALQINVSHHADGSHPLQVTHDVGSVTCDSHEHRASTPASGETTKSDDGCCGAMCSMAILNSVSTMDLLPNSASTDRMIATEFSSADAPNLYKPPIV